MKEKTLTVKIVYTKNKVKVDGEKMDIFEWVYSTIKSNSDYDNIGILDVLDGDDSELEGSTDARCDCWECQYGDDSELEGLAEPKPNDEFKKFLESENKKLLKELKSEESK